MNIYTEPQDVSLEPKEVAEPESPPSRQETAMRCNDLEWCLEKYAYVSRSRPDLWIDKLEMIEFAKRR